MPLERCGWTQDLAIFKQWLDSINPSGGGPFFQPVLAGEAQCFKKLLKHP
jgi:hypothetical protein